MAKRHACHSANGHRWGALEDKTVDSLARDLNRCREINGESPGSIHEDRMVWREAQAPFEFHKRCTPARDRAAHEADDFGLGAVEADDMIALDQLRERTEAAIGHLHRRVAIDAACIGIVVGSHAHRCSIVAWPVGARGGLGRREVAEDLVSLFADLTEELATVVLHAWVLEVVADLQLVREHHRGEIVQAPLVVIVQTAQGLCGLALHVLQQRLHVRVACGWRGLDGLRSLGHCLQCLPHVVRRICALLRGELHGTPDRLHEVAPAPLLLDNEVLLAACVARELGLDVLDLVDAAHSLVLSGCRYFRLPAELELQHHVALLTKLKPSKAQGEEVFLLHHVQAPVHLHTFELGRLLHCELHLLRHRHQRLTHHADEGSADKAGIRNEGVGAQACRGQVDQQPAVQVIAEAKGVDDAWESLVLFLVRHQLRDDVVPILGLTVRQKHDVAKTSRLIRLTQALQALVKALPDVRGSAVHHLFELLLCCGLSGLIHDREREDHLRHVVEGHHCQAICRFQRV
mmetsp:Transcript_13931/g.32675  ORF Transcript_13931/g.32675 Transcript_13931/m.32675 type:complete len:518 (+) Transcript_13931:291-1844(+)